MADLNKVFLMGSLAFDPELRYTPSGTAVTDLRLVVGRSWTGKDGERKEEKLYIDVTVWNRQAENCCQYLKKGRPVHVEGYLRSESWDDKNTGEKRSKIKIEADRVQFIGGRDDSGAGGGGMSDGDYAPSSTRESTTRRGSGSYADSRGSGAPAARGPAAPSPGPRRAAEPAGEPEEDIPF